MQLINFEVIKKQTVMSVLRNGAPPKVGLNSNVAITRMSM